MAVAPEPPVVTVAPYPPQRGGSRVGYDAGRGFPAPPAQSRSAPSGASRSCSGPNSAGGAAITRSGPACLPCRPPTYAPASRGDQPTRSEVPRVQPALVERVQPSGRYGAQVQRGGAVPPDVAYAGQHLGEHLRLPGAAGRRVPEAGADQGAREVGLVRAAQRAAVAGGAATADRLVRVPLGRVVHGPCNGRRRRARRRWTRRSPGSRTGSSPCRRAGRRPSAPRSRCPRRAPSSARIPSPGRASRSPSTIRCSAAVSISVTTSVGDDLVPDACRSRGRRSTSRAPA